MDPSAQYQQYQNQSQPYDPSSAAYYSYSQYANYQYYPQDYSNFPQPHLEDTTSVHPPGVPVSSQSQYVGQDQYYAYHHHQQQQQYDSATWQGVESEAVHTGARNPVGPSYSGGGRRGGRGRGSSFRGKGRGGGRGGPSHKSIPGAPPQQPAPLRQMAWCELCRVDCNSLDILEKHREGKKHKKNLKMQEELEHLNRIIVDRRKAKVQEQEVVETKAEHKQQNVSETSGSRGRGSKRKMRGGRGGNKWMRTSEGSKTPVDPPKPKQPVVPFICELCHVTCESQVVFDSHLKGKKHMANIQHFQEQQTLLGQVALEALYPALQAILPALQGIYPPNPDASTSSTLAPEVQDPQVILTQLLTSILAPGQVAPTLGQDRPNLDGSTSSALAPQLQGGQDLQVVLTQLLTSILAASGQAAVTPGAASTSVMGLPVVSENQNPENLPIQSEAGSEKEADPAVIAEKKSEDLETKSEMDKVDAQQATKP